MIAYTVDKEFVFADREHVKPFNLDDFVEIDNLVHIVTKIDRGENIVYLTKLETYREEMRRGGLRVVAE